MKMAVGSDSVSNLTHEITAYLEKKGIELIRCGSLAGEEADYVDAARDVAEAVGAGKCEQGLTRCSLATKPSVRKRLIR